MHARTHTHTHTHTHTQHARTHAHIPFIRIKLANGVVSHAVNWRFQQALHLANSLSKLLVVSRAGEFLLSTSKDFSLFSLSTQVTWLSVEHRSVGSWRSSSRKADKKTKNTKRPEKKKTFPLGQNQLWQTVTVTACEVKCDDASTTDACIDDRRSTWTTNAHTSRRRDFKNFSDATCMWIDLRARLVGPRNMDWWAAEHRVMWPRNTGWCPN